MTLKKIELEHTIRELIESKKEGDYWDFKQKYHDNNADLVKDILCLANTTNYQGDRYIIFGINDQYEFVKLDKVRRTQAQIINILRDANFESGKYPDIYLETIQIDSNTLDVLIIKDKPEKPYYLYKQKKEGKKVVNEGVIYSRTRDSNGIASSSDMEIMWRERFGLILSPLDRAKKYLAEKDSWKLIDAEAIYHYKQFPEFTIQEIKSCTCSSLCDCSSELECCNQEWTRGELINYKTAEKHNKNYALIYKIKFHQTTLATITIIVFDDKKKTIVLPEWKVYRGGRIYYYLKNSIEYAYQKFLVIDYSISLRFTSECRKGNFSIPIFEDERDLQDFLEFVSDDNSYEPVMDNDMDLQNEIFYESIDKYIEYKKLNNN